jgi:hypothetical protein
VEGWFSGTATIAIAHEVAVAEAVQTPLADAPPIVGREIAVLLGVDVTDVMGGVDTVPHPTLA